MKEQYIIFDKTSAKEWRTWN